jgi:uncharacterized protein
MRALLDVNVLVALLDANHIRHGSARRWLEANIADGWASCALTQIGCLRVLASPTYPNALKPIDAASRLSEATSHVLHQFWGETPSAFSLGLLNWEYLVTARQVSAAYLLALAVRQAGRLVTFESTLRPAVMAGARSHHLVVL